MKFGEYRLLVRKSTLVLQSHPTAKRSFYLLRVKTNLVMSTRYAWVSFYHLELKAKLKNTYKWRMSMYYYTGQSTGPKEKLRHLGKY